MCCTEGDVTCLLVRHRAGQHKTLAVRYAAKRSTVKRPQRGTPLRGVPHDEHNVYREENWCWHTLCIGSFYKTDGGDLLCSLFTSYKLCESLQEQACLKLGVFFSKKLLDNFSRDRAKSLYRGVCSIQGKFS